MKRSACLFCLLWIVVCAGTSPAGEGYQKPPEEVLKVLQAPPPPTPFLSPTGGTLLLAQPFGYPPIAALGEPMLCLAGVRVNPRTNAERSYLYYWVGLTMTSLLGGAETRIELPAGIRTEDIDWNAAGTMVAFTNEAEDRVELWVVDVAGKKARRLPELRINPVLGSAFQWMPDQKTLLVKLIPQNRGGPPEPPAVPPGPRIEESTGASAASSTYEARDLLRGPHDADLFDYYATSQLALVDAITGEATRIGKPAVFSDVRPAPGGSYLLVERIHRPYSYLRAYYRFPKEVELWSTKGDMVETLATVPLAEQVPIDGVPTGPRNYSWCATEPATVVWVEALDGGNPGTKVPHRDRLMIRKIPGEAAELWKSEHRFDGLDWVEGGGLALAAEYDRNRRWTRTHVLDTLDRAKPPRLLWDMSGDEKYGHPGSPVLRAQPTGSHAVLRQGDWIYTKGLGSSPDGDRPFLDRLNLKTLQTQRLFRSDRSSFEYFVGWLDPAAGTFMTRRESPNDAPNFFIRTMARKPLRGAPAGEAAWTSTARAVTGFTDPAPQLRLITKRLVTYVRDDGVPLSFTLYLPPDYKPGTRLPTVFWAYPLEYAETSVAGQIEGSTSTFTTLRGSSHLFFLLQGYAVLDDVAMPMVGPPETVYDTYVEQLRANAKAAVDKAVEMGVADPDRIGVGGHSHGAFMTANLLVYTDLFRAGIARSGAYNHTMRPFGFQNEKRTFWKARDTYIKLSPVLQADKINEPLLLIHGELDQNPGTVAMQSEKFFEAVRGIGGTVRLVMLPHESHGYRALESVEHVLYEMLSWFDRYVKNAPPRGSTADAAKE